MPIKDYSSMSREEKLAYHEGYREALWEYAWWKEGRAMVGSGVLSHAEALNSLLNSHPLPMGTTLDD